MTKNKNSFLEVDVGNENGMLAFASIDDITQFIEMERNHWNWLFVEPNKFPEVTRHLSQLFNQLTNAVSTFSQNPNNLPSIQNALTNMFYKERVPLSDSSLGVLISQTAITAPKLAMNCLRVLTPGLNANFNDFDQIKALMLVGSTSLGITAKNGSRAAKSFAAATSKLREATAEAKVAINSHQLEFDQVKKEANHTRELLKRFARVEAKKSKKKVDDSAQEAINNIKDVEALYLEQMALDAPVDYWQKKADEHKKQSEINKQNLLIFSIGGAFFLAVLFGILISTGIDFALKKLPSSVFLLLASAGVIASTVIFWVARVLTRLFLSQEHLKIDADERAVMIKTYLALTKEKSISDEERHIVLAPIFRPTADGIVKDDSPTDLSLPNLLSRQNSS